jgi:hypothetical protein
MRYARSLSIFPDCEASGPTDGQYDEQIQQQNRSSGSEEKAMPDDVHDVLDFMYPENSERVVREGDCAEPMVTTWFPLYTETTTTYAPAISPDRPLEKIDTASHCSGPSEPPERTAEVMPSGHASVVITVDRRNISIVVIDIPDWHGLVANKLTRALWLR